MEEIEEYEMCKDKCNSTKSKIMKIMKIETPKNSLDNISKNYEEIDNTIEELHNKLNKHFKELLGLLDYSNGLKGFKVIVDKNVVNLDDVEKYNLDVVNTIYRNIKEKLSSVEKQFEYYIYKINNVVYREEIKGIGREINFSIQCEDDIKTGFKKKNAVYEIIRSEYITKMYILK